MIGFLLSLINPLAAVAKEIALWQQKREAAKTDRERIYADERIKAAEAKRDTLIAASKLQAEEAKVSPLNIIMRALLTTPVVVLLFKVLVYDKALGQWTGGRTDPLDPNLWNVVMAVIGFYFIYEGATTIARIIKR